MASSVSKSKLQTKPGHFIREIIFFAGTVLLFIYGEGQGGEA